MEMEKRVLELVKEKPLLMSEIREILGVSLQEVIDTGVLPFLRKYELAEITPTNEGGLVRITARGLQLLELPNLPVDEPPSSEVELPEREWGDAVEAELGQEMKWLFLMQMARRIRQELGAGEGSTTFERRGGNYILTGGGAATRQVAAANGGFREVLPHPKGGEGDGGGLFQRRGSD